MNASKLLPFFAVLVLVPPYLAAAFLLLAGSLPAAQLSPDADYADYPALAAAPNGDLFAAWVSYDQKGADQVRLRRYTNGRW